MSKLVTIAALALLMTTVNGPAYATPFNIGLESGDFSGGWLVSNSSRTSVVASAASRQATLTPAAAGDPVDWLAWSGSRFAFLEAGDTGVYTTISRTFAANVGDRLLAAAFFDAADFKDNTWNDDGYVRVFDVANSVYLSPKFNQSNSTVALNQGSAGWTPLSYLFTAAGLYTIEAGVRNVADDTVSASLGLDAQYIDAGQLSASAVPEPGTWMLFGGGGLSLALAHYRRRRTATA